MHDAVVSTSPRLNPSYAALADWIVQCFTSPPTQYRLYGRRAALASLVGMHNAV